MKNSIITVEDIRLINENLEKRLVHIHLFSSNKPIVRTIGGYEIHTFTRLRSRVGMAEAKQYMADLINEKYAEPQAIKEVPLSREDEAFFERYNFSQIFRS